MLIWLGWAFPSPLIRVPARLALLGLGALLVAAVVVFGLRRFMYRIGGRLALSYFLVGIVPIPLLVLLLALVGYQFNGFFVGHLYRDALQATHQELQQHAATALHDGPHAESVAVAAYENGRRVSGNSELPARWPAWLEDRGDAPPFVAFGEDGATLAAVSGSSQRGALAAPEAAAGWTARFCGGANSEARCTTWRPASRLPIRSSRDSTRPSE